MYSTFSRSTLRDGNGLQWGTILWYHPQTELLKRECGHFYAKLLTQNLVKYKHEPARKHQHCPYEPAPEKYGRETNEVTKEPERPHVDDEKKKYVK